MYWLNTILILCLTLCSPIDSLARMYKWVDENGQIHFSDKKPIVNEKEGNTGAPRDIKDSPKYNFRKTRWGMSRYEVLENEVERGFTAEPETHDFDEKLSCELNVFGEPGVLVYGFLEGKLVQAEYAFPGDNERDYYISDFTYFENRLKEEYGEPNKEKADALPFKTSWVTDSTEIDLIYEKIPIIGYHFCTINFRSKEFKPLIEKRKAENEAKLNEETKKWIAEFERKKELSKQESNSGFSNASRVIRQYCAKKWGNDFRMQKYCIEKQKEALLDLKKGKPQDIPAEVFGTIRSKCESKWGNDYRMRRYCEKKQMSAWRTLNH